MSDSEDVSDDADIFVVECILAESWDEEQACPIYLIKWDGYDLYESTWETQDSFEDGAEDVLNNWAEVQEKRRNGDLEDFDVAAFEVNRQKWLRRLKRKRSRESSDHRSGHKLLQVAEEAGSSSDEAKEDSTLNGAAQSQSKKPNPKRSRDEWRQTKDHIGGKDTNRSTGKHKRQQHPTAAMQRTTSSGSASSNLAPSHVGSTAHGDAGMRRKDINNFTESRKPVSHFAGNDEQYQARDKVFTMAKLNAELKKKKFKVKSDTGLSNEDKYVKEVVLTPPPEATPQLPQHVATGSETKAPPRVLPKTLKAAREAKSRAQDISKSPQTRQLDGLIFVSDRVAVEPTLLYTLMKKVRNSKWRFMMSRLAYEDIQSRGNERLARDYQTLRDKEKICLAEKNNMIQVAAQGRVRHAETCRRFVVIGEENVPFSFVPNGIEASTPNAFRAGASPE